MELEDLTPVQKINNIYIKRDDLFEFAGCKGGKVRSALYIINKAIQQGYTNFVSVGSRFSPQCEIISCICEQLNYKCYLFMPKGKDTTILKSIYKNKNTTLIRELDRGSYTNVLVSRARKFAAENNCYYIEFGMELPETIDITSKQVQNIPEEVKRIVIPVGSAMNYCSVLNGLQKYNRTDIEVLGIQVGKDPMQTIYKYYPMFNFSNYKIIKSEYTYETQLNKSIGDLILDPIYEAKCAEYLKENDLLWVVGKRK